MLSTIEPINEKAGMESDYGSEDDTKSQKNNKK